MGVLTIERLGGLAGFGGPHLKSEGRLAFTRTCPPTIRQRSKAFHSGSQAELFRNTNDVFNYRSLARRSRRLQSIEVPESLRAETLRSSVKDTLR